MFAETNNINALFCSAGSIDISSPSSIEVARNTLDEISRDIANDLDLRQRMGRSGPSIWPVLYHLWHTSAKAHVDERYEPLIKQLIPALAKFTRNLVANVPFNQTCAFEVEPQIRQLLFSYTSFYAYEDQSTFPITLLLAQAISNIVTSNETLLARLWDLYMNVPEEQSTITRLLASPDPGTILSTLILILNCIHESLERAVLFTVKPPGLRTCIAILDRMVSLHDLEELSEGGKAFEIGYSIFSRLVDLGVISDLYTSIAVDGEIITPHQTVLLKLMDSHLQTSPLTVELCQQLSPTIASTFFDLAEYVENALEPAFQPEQSPQSIRSSLPSTSTSPGTAPLSVTPITPLDGQSATDAYVAAITNKQDGGQAQGQETAFIKELDMLLPQICEALVLLTQCLITLALTSEDPEFDFPDGDNPKDFFNSAMIDEGYGLVEVLISLLRRLDQFLLRIMFGKPVSTTYPHLPFATNEESIGDNAEGDEGPAKRGFAYLKRDLVRLLGILCSGDKPVQDRIRHCGGIPVVMNLCVDDDRNPYLREHAIFALHNLLEGNLENQAAVDKIRPITSNSGGSTNIGVHISGL